MKNIEEIISYTQKLKLLYVEDNDEARESTTIILEEFFDNITIAINGQDGFNKFKQNDIDLIITDINMPNMDGLEMSKQIKTINPTIPIIILTALTNISVLKDAIDIGVDSFINKPLEDIELLVNKLDLSIKKICYENGQKEILKIKHDNEKMELLIDTMQNIAHHWRQPLSVISTISSVCTVKVELGENVTLDDLKNAEIITKKTEKLSLLLDKIEQIQIERISSQDIEELIAISNPIIV
ncbi:MAG: response regulator [Campylobacterota bacterium]|nr:response regulator [Campylobacterota bacterium]